MQIRINLPVGNHPSRTFSANQDAFLQRKSSLPEIFGRSGCISRWKSSLTDISSKSGCISPLGIIPPGHFQQIRMHFSARNHPSQKFPANQDAFPRWKSSLPDIFSKSRCISPTGIIPPRHFHRIRMHFSAGNHPSRTFPVNQDAFPQRKSSLLKFLSNQDTFLRRESSR